MEGRVGIVVPVHATGDRLGYLERTLRSVLAQTHTAFEVVVVDDGSPGDDVPALVASLHDPRVRCIRQSRRGVATARNAGAAALRPGFDVVCFLDSDDLWAPTFLATTLAALHGDSQAVAAYALADFVDEHDAPLSQGWFADLMLTRGGLRCPTSDDAYTRLVDVAFANPVYPPSSMVVRWTAWEATAGFDPRFEAGDDWDMVVQLARLGPLRLVPEVLVGYRRHSTNLSATTTRNVREARMIWASVLRDPSLPAQDRAELVEAWRTRQRASARHKAGQAAASLREGRAPQGARLAADALGHLLLRRPLRSWALPPVANHRSEPS